jgi:hypothetical protein
VANRSTDPQPQVIQYRKVQDAVGVWYVVAVSSNIAVWSSTTLEIQNCLSHTDNSNNNNNEMAQHFDEGMVRD